MRRLGLGNPGVLLCVERPKSPSYFAVSEDYTRAWREAVTFATGMLLHFTVSAEARNTAWTSARSRASTGLGIDKLLTGRRSRWTISPRSGCHGSSGSHFGNAPRCIRHAAVASASKTAHAAATGIQLLPSAHCVSLHIQMYTHVEIGGPSSSLLPPALQCFTVRSLRLPCAQNSMYNLNMRRSGYTRHECRWTMFLESGKSERIWCSTLR